MNRRTIIAAAASAAALVVLAVGYVIFVRDGSSGRTNNQAIAGPVLLVPGYGGSTQSLTTLAEALGAQGRQVLIVAMPGNAEGDIDEQAKVLQKAVAKALQQYVATTVDIVGYSAGGVVARDYVKSYGGDAIVRRVVSLGSPHHGTGIAALGARLQPGLCPTACQQLAPKSKLLARLNKGDETPSGPTWVSIWTGLDQVVTPPESAKLSGALNIKVQDICATSQVDHSGLPSDPVTVGMVLKEVAPGEPVRLTTADCSSLNR